LGKQTKTSVGFGGGIESRPLWKPMHLQPIFASYPYYGSDVAELYSDGLCLPSGSNLNGGDDQRIAES
jgi:hypothetical protein